jgi:acetylornithine deacetylase
MEQRTLLVREPFEIDAGAEVVARAAGRVRRRDGIAARRRRGQLLGDSAFLAAAGIPTVLFGPGGEGAHAAEEWVSLRDTAVVARTLTSMAARFCA